MVIDTTDIATLGVKLIKSNGELDIPKVKRPLSYNWQDEDGLDIDLTTMRINLQSELGKEQEATFNKQKEIEAKRTEEIKKAIELKERINKSIEESDFNSLANPIWDNCFNCNYRPLCDQYKTKFINNFDNKRVDVFGEVIEIKGVSKYEIKLLINGKEIFLKGISSTEDITIGEKVYIYNLYCPDGNSAILYALKETIIKNE